MGLIEPLLAAVRSLIDSLAPRPRETACANPLVHASPSRRSRPNDAQQQAAHPSSASELEAIDMPGEASSPDEDTRIEAEILRRRLRHFDEESRGWRDDPARKCHS